jgi:glucose repression mediator protein
MGNNIDDHTGSLAELMGNLEEAMIAYEHALRSNPRSISAMNAISCILRTQEHFHKAVEYLQNILKLDGNNGDVWGSLGEIPGACERISR